jgi:3-oxoacyl-[acyl-carrier-protein] synthase II
MKRRVVVTGIGAITSLGCRIDEMWKHLCEGRSGVRTIQRFDASQFRSRIAGEVPDFSMDAYIPAKDLKKLDRCVQFGLIAGVDAVTDSGIDFSREDPFRCGAIIGSGIGGLETIEVQHLRLMEKGPDKISPFTIPKLMPNASAGQVAIRYQLRGPCGAVATACASATNAIGDAHRLIACGDVDVMVTGGTEAVVTPIGVGAFSAMRALSERNDDPPAASRPFDKDRDGFVLGEGAGCLVLEELEHAKARDARIYAEVLGYGCSSDGSHITQPDKDGVAAAFAMNQALQTAGLNPTDIDYINAHGTSTPLGDEAETTAIKKVFKDHAYQVSISSTKSQLGHLLGASGGVELLVCALAIRDGIVPPTINYHTPDPLCDLDYTPNTARRRQIRTAMSNSFGFGGHNGSIILGAIPNGK